MLQFRIETNKMRFPFMCVRIYWQRIVRNFPAEKFASIVEYHIYYSVFILFADERTIFVSGQRPTIELFARKWFKKSQFYWIFIGFRCSFYMINTILPSRYGYFISFTRLEFMLHSKYSNCIFKCYTNWPQRWPINFTLLFCIAMHGKNNKWTCKQIPLWLALGETVLLTIYSSCCVVWVQIKAISKYATLTKKKFIPHLIEHMLHLFAHSTHANKTNQRSAMNKDDWIKKTASYMTHKNEVTRKMSEWEADGERRRATDKVNSHTFSQDRWESPIRYSISENIFTVTTVPLGTKKVANFMRCPELLIIRVFNGSTVP